MIREHHMRDRLESVRAQMQNHIGSVKREMEKLSAAVAIKYTGFMALMRKTETGWECLRIVDTRNLPEEIEEDFDVAMPIPEPESIPEFQGW